MKLIIALLVIGAALVIAGLYFAGVGIGGRAIGLAVPGASFIVAALMRAADKQGNDPTDGTMSKIVLLGLLGATQIVIGLYYAGEGDGSGAMIYAVSGIAGVVIAALAAMDKLENEIMDDTHGEDFRCDEHGNPVEVDRDR